MKNSKNKRTIILAGILLALLVVAYKVVFMSSDTEILIDPATLNNELAGSQSMVVVLEELKNINFDTNIMSDPIFESFRSIEIPLISMPVGRNNPFSGTFSSN